MRELLHRNFTQGTAVAHGHSSSGYNLGHLKHSKCFVMTLWLDWLYSAPTHMTYSAKDVFESVNYMENNSHMKQMDFRLLILKVSMSLLLFFGVTIFIASLSWLIFAAG